MNPIYNALPDNAVIITDYEEIRSFWGYEIVRQGFREPYYKTSILDGSYKLRIFWVDAERQLGFGIADDVQAKKIVWYKFGSAENWQIYDNSLKEKFKGDRT